ncbi:PHP domain-containing protein [Candidatus Azambacteria bacterium]|nr:PHP domain-containing protein [Candidatus Azambacteria bacterium]
MKLKTNLHFHSSEDPYHVIKHSLKEGIDKAASLKFDVLAITCHDFFVDTKDLENYAKEKGILLIPGIEIGIERGRVSKEGRHLLVLGCEKDAEKIYDFSDLRQYKKEHPEILVVAPHPYFYGNISLKDYLEKNIDTIDAIELSWFYSKIFNRNKKAENTAKKFNKPIIATSDTHFFDYMDRSFAFVETEEKTQKSVFEAIRKNKIENTTSPVNSIKDMLIRQCAFTIAD